MTVRLPLLPVASLAALFLAACAPTTMDLEARGTEGVDYSQYKTYAWVPLDAEARDSFTAADKRVRAAFVGEVDGILARRGMTQVTSGTPDLYVYARGARSPGYREVGKTPSYDARYVPDVDGSAWLAGPGTAGGSGYQTAETRTAVRLLITEPESDRVVWRGRGTVGVDERRSEEMLLLDARTVARRLLDGFPPQS